MVDVRLVVADEAEKGRRTQILELYLEQCGDDVELNCKEEDGSMWVLASVTPRGLVLHADIATYLGLPVDRHGRLKVLKQT